MNRRTRGGTSVLMFCDQYFPQNDEHLEWWANKWDGAYEFFLFVLVMVDWTGEIHHPHNVNRSKQEKNEKAVQRENELFQLLQIQEASSTKQRH